MNKITTVGSNSTVVDIRLRVVVDMSHGEMAIDCFASLICNKALTKGLLHENIDSSFGGFNWKKTRKVSSTQQNARLRFPFESK